MYDCVVDLRPRWVVIFRRATEAFTLKFNQLDEMILAISRAKSIGYQAKVLQAKGER